MNDDYKCPGCGRPSGGIDDVLATPSGQIWHEACWDAQFENKAVFAYKGALYPEYIRNGNACRFILPTAREFCRGQGLDVGAGKWPLPGAVSVELADGGDAMALPEGPFDYVFSSHCLEHLADPVAAIEHWKTRLKPGGVLFLYLPHPDMRYWRPQFNRKHRHLFWPDDTAEMLRDLGFVDVIHSERDLAWGFAVVGFVPHG